MTDKLLHTPGARVVFAAAASVLGVQSAVVLVDARFFRRDVPENVKPTALNVRTVWSQLGRIVGSPYENN